MNPTDALNMVRSWYPIDVTHGRAEVPKWTVTVATAAEHAEAALLLLASDDPDDRLRATAALEAAARSTLLPAGTWAVWSTYRDGWGGPGRIAKWSAHPTEEDARAAHAMWVAHWAGRRDDYDTHVGPRDDMHPSYLYPAGVVPQPRT